MAMETDECVDLKVTVECGSAGYWNVRVHDGAGEEFAMSSARGLDLALRGALPYMAAVVDEAGSGVARALVEAQRRAEAPA